MGANQDERMINFAISSTRMMVERSFGILKSRFRILSKGPDVWEVFHSAEIVIACCVIHNICRREGDLVPSNVDEDAPYLTKDQAAPFVAINGRSLADAHRALPAGAAPAEVLPEQPWLAPIPTAAAWAAMTPTTFREKMVVNIALRQRKNKASVSVTSLAGRLLSGTDAAAALDVDGKTAGDD